LSGKRRLHQRADRAAAAAAAAAVDDIIVGARSHDDLPTLHPGHLPRLLARSPHTPQNDTVAGLGFTLEQFVAGHSSMQHASPLRELTCRVGSHSVACHPAELTFPPSPQPKLVWYSI